MPVQDNDDKRTADQPAVDAEEEIRRKQAQVQEQQQEESGAQKSGKHDIAAAMIDVVLISDETGIEVKFSI